MYIQEIIIENYKSFASAQIIHFSKGVNLVVGKNNVGKTALLEALTFSSNNPHISDKSKPRKTLKNQEESTFTGKFILSTEEFEDYIHDFTKSKFFLNQKIHEFVYQWIHDELRYGFYKKKLDDQGNYFIIGDDKEPWWQAANDGEIDKFIEKISSCFNQKISISCIFKLNSKKIRIENLHLDSIDSELEAAYEFQKNGKKIELLEHHNLKNSKDIGAVLIDYFVTNKIYKFDVHRRVGSSYGVTKKTELTPDCGNLPAVLLVFQSDTVGFDEYKKAVKEIFPELQDVIISPNDSGEAEIRIWNTIPIKDRTDLAIPLKDCGTGIGQVLAILYLVISSASPQVIIIDEPNSFLHPSASRKLINIFNRYPQHQYIISTHSPEIIASNPDNLILLTLENGETKVKVLETEQKQGIQDAIKEIGLKLSDVYGFDSILWVEGPTEQVCFPKIIAKFFPRLEGNLAVEAVKHTSDFEKKYLETTINLYQKLSGRDSYLIPPAIAYVFDNEGKTEDDIRDLKRIGKQASETKDKDIVHFIKPRLYENFILDSDAIAFSLNQYSSQYGLGQIYTSEEINIWIEANKADTKYWDKGKQSQADSAEWKEKIHAAKLLNNLFKKFLDNKVSYQKTVDSVKLTEYLLDNKPEVFDSLKQLLGQFLPK